LGRWMKKNPKPLPFQSKGAATRKPRRFNLQLVIAMSQYCGELS
jgi:hypothetical protein